MANTLRPNEWNTALAATTDPNKISIATFNTLRRNYEFKGKYWVTSTVKEWKTRQAMLKNVVAALGTDIICLQEGEASTFDEDFSFVTELGYTAIKPTAKKGEHDFTKPSILYRASRFTLKWQEPRSRTLLVQFEDNTSKRQFYVINCHLQGSNGQEDQRCFQAKSAIEKVQKHAKTTTGITCFLCGDFNETPTFPLHTFIQQGKPTSEEVEKYFKGKPFTFAHTLGFKDSFGHLKERPFTFKWGVKDDAEYQTIDYIYFTENQIEAQSIRLPLTEEQEGPMKETLGLPNSWNPSDHLPIAGLFKFK